MSAMAAETRAAESVVRRYLLDGVLFGAMAYVGGYLLTLLFVTFDGVSFTGEAGRLTIAGWVFYAAHTVGIEVTGLAGRRSNTVVIHLFEGFGELSGLTSTVPELMYMAVPIVALVGAGYIVRWRIDEPGLETSTVALLGTSTVAGYLPLAVLGRILFAHSEARTALGEEVTLTVSPAVSTTLFVAGVLYPIVCSGIGAALAQQTTSAPTTARS